MSGTVHRRHTDDLILAAALSYALVTSHPQVRDAELRLSRPDGSSIVMSPQRAEPGLETSTAQTLPHHTDLLPLASQEFQV